MTQDDKPHGLMSAEALALVHSEIAHAERYGLSYWPNRYRTDIPRLLAHIAALQRELDIAYGLAEAFGEFDVRSVVKIALDNPLDLKEE